MSRAALIYIENILIRVSVVFACACWHNRICYGCLQCLIRFELIYGGVRYDEGLNITIIITIKPPAQHKPDDITVNVIYFCCVCY